MHKTISIDPSGTGTTGIYLQSNNQEVFQEYKSNNWKDHYTYILKLVQEYQPNLVLFEDTNYIHRRTKDGLSLFRLLGALECLTLESIQRIEKVNVLAVKKLTKQLLTGTTQIQGLEYLLGRGKGWMYQGKRVSIHQLEAYLVYWIKKNR